MRSKLMTIEGNEEFMLTGILRQILRSPGSNETIQAFFTVANSEPLALLYDVWATAQTVPNHKYEVYQVFCDRYNVYIGEDTLQREALFGVELFEADLDELCVALNTWIETGQCTKDQVAIAEAASGYFRVNPPNPGAMNIIRGWHELMLVIRGQKLVMRCVAPDCGKILLLNTENELLSGTSSGYHNHKCLVDHTSGAQQDAIAFQELPGAGQLQEAIGEVTSADGGDAPEETA